MNHHKLIRNLLSCIVAAAICGLLLCPAVSYADAPAATRNQEPPHAGGYRETREYDLWEGDSPDEEGFSEEGESWGDEESRGDDWDSWDEDWDDDGYWDDDWDEGYWDEDWDDGYGSDGEQGYGYSDEPLTWENGLGSAKELDGRIVVVSIFLSDKNTSWDFTKEKDQLRREHSLEYLGIATDWITENAALWGKYPEFIYDWEQYGDLYYEMEIDENVASDYDDPTDDMNDLIEAYVDPESLLQEYDADSILFLAYLNSSNRNMTVSYTIPYDDSLGDDTMEICYLFLFSDGEEETPAAYAHEMLHVFGAPDLYTAQYPATNYNIGEDYVSYCEVYHPNEIMNTTYDVDTDESYYDHISNELTEITAYYIGWTDTCKDVEEFGLQESQHVS